MSDSTERHPFVQFYLAHEGLVWLLIITIPIAVIGLGLWLLPEIFYDQFIWKYYLETFVKDSNYNPVDTTTYGIILALALFSIYRIIKRFKIVIDQRFIFSLLPFIILGGSSRALEDAELFKEPFKYLLISPVIYIVIGLAVLALLLFAVALERLYAKGGVWANYTYVLVIALFTGSVFGYAIVTTVWAGLIRYIIPLPMVTIISMILALALILLARQRGRFEVAHTLFFIGLFPLLLSFLGMSRWMLGAKWFADSDPIRGYTILLILAFTINAAMIFLLVLITASVFKRTKARIPSPLRLGPIGLLSATLMGMGAIVMGVTILYLRATTVHEPLAHAPEHVEVYWNGDITVIYLYTIFIAGLAIATFLLLLVLRKRQRATPKSKPLLSKYIAPFFLPLNFALICGHLVDASATFTGIDFFGYIEKHVLPAFLITLGGNSAWVMFPLKIVIISLIIIIIDVGYEEELAKERNLVGLIKLCILILGLAPGLRDAFRLAMGV